MPGEFENTATAGARARGDVNASEPILSARETEILEWVAQGKSNTDIAEILEISPHTVGTHLRRILAKMDASSRTTAAVRAAQLGLLPPI